MKNEFDDKAATWDDDPKRVKRAEVIGEIIKHRVDLTNVKLALEYGSGTGLLSFAMKESLAKVVLMDESAEMTRVAEEKFTRAGIKDFRPVCYDLMEDPLPTERFDFIYIMLTLHHIDDYRGLIKKFAELLRPGGHLAIIDLEAEDGSFHDGEFHGHHGFDRGQLEEALFGAGLAEDSYEVCYKLEKTREDGTKRHYPLFLLVASRKG